MQLKLHNVNLASYANPFRMPAIPRADHARLVYE
jgi:hypothetical protein